MTAIAETKRKTSGSNTPNYAALTSINTGAMGSGGTGSGMGMSDIQLKNNIQPINNALNRLCNL